MKHTKGQWEIRPVMAEVLPHHLPLNGIYKGGILLATTGNYNHIGSEDVANLIAAAPELLEACQKLIEIAPRLWGIDIAKWPRIMDRIEKAVMKAVKG